MSIASQEINRELDITAVLRQLVAAALSITHAQGGGNASVRRGSSCSASTTRHGGDCCPNRISFCPGVGVGSGHATRTFISATTPATIRMCSRRSASHGFDDLLNTPIIGRDGDMLGCFEIHDKPRDFDETDARLLQGLAASAAVALENTALLGERQGAAEPGGLRESEADRLVGAGECRLWNRRDRPTGFDHGV